MMMEFLNIGFYFMLYIQKLLSCHLHLILSKHLLKTFIADKRNPITNYSKIEDFHNNLSNIHLNFMSLKKLYFQKSM